MYLNYRNTLFGSLDSLVERHNLNSLFHIMHSKDVSATLQRCHV